MKIPYKVVTPIQSGFSLCFTINGNSIRIMSAGNDECILGYTHNMVRSFYETYYHPSNAVLALVGDFNTEEVLGQVEEYFGSIPAGNVPEEIVPVEPEQTEARMTVIEHPSNLQRLALSFHSTSGTDSMNPAMVMIAAYLSSGRSARLNQLLVETGLAYKAWVSKDNRLDPGLFKIFVVMNPADEQSASLDEVEQIIWEELDSLAANGIPEATLNELKNQYRAAEVLRGSYPLSLALNYSYYYSLFEDPLYKKHQLEEIECLTSQDISAAATAYFRRNLVNTAVLLPNKEGNTVAGAEREGLSASTQEPSTINYEGLEITDEFLMPPGTTKADGVVEYTLDNGLRLIVKEDHTFPVVSTSFSIPMGDNMDPDSLYGLAAVTCETMMQGTEELEYNEFHSRLESEGSYLKFLTDETFSIGYVTTLSEDLDTAFATISDLLLRPAFRETDFNRVISGQQTELERLAENLLSIAGDNLTAITTDTLSEVNLVSCESLENISLLDVKNFYHRCCRPDGSVITVVGDVNPEEIFLVTKNYFDEWTNPYEPLPELHPSSFSQAQGDTVVAFVPGKTQTAILVGSNAPGELSEDYPAFKTMSNILGGGLGSRLWISLRDEQGLAYGVGAWISGTNSTSLFTAYLSTLTEYTPQALASVIYELELICTEDVLDIELRLAKANAVGEEALSCMTYNDLAYSLTYLAASGRPLNWTSTLLGEVLNLTVSDIREVAENYLDPDYWFVSISGTINEEDLQ